jgi:hypothetical protein
MAKRLPWSTVNTEHARVVAAYLQHLLDEARRVVAGLLLLLLLLLGQLLLPPDGFPSVLGRLNQVISA